MDLIYAPYRGVVWTADTAVPMADTAELAFTVDDDGELRFYERIRRPVDVVGVRPQAGREGAPEDCGAADARVDEAVTEAEQTPTTRSGSRTSPAGTRNPLPAWDARAAHPGRTPRPFTGGGAEHRAAAR